MQPKDLDAKIEESTAHHIKNNNQIEDFSVRVEWHKLKKQEERIDNYFTFGFLISLILVSLYAYYLISGREVPSHLVGFMGSIITYFFLVKAIEQQFKTQ